MATLDLLIEAIRANASALRDLSEHVEGLRSSIVPDMIGLALFAVYAWPEVSGIAKLYQRMFSEYPLPAWRRAGVRNEHIESARHAVFFYLLFLLYILVQFVFTWGPSSWFELAADLLIQLTLLGLVLGNYSSVRHALYVRHMEDPRKRERVAEWLNEKFDDMKISFATLRRKTLVIFLASISLVVAQLAPSLAQAILRVLELARATLSYS